MLCFNFGIFTLTSKENWKPFPERSFRQTVYFQLVYYIYSFFASTIAEIEDGKSAKTVLLRLRWQILYLCYQIKQDVMKADREALL